MKRFLPILMIFIMICLTACGQTREPGGIETKEPVPLTIVSNMDKTLFNDITNAEKPDFEFETFYDYHAGISIPYPKDWAVKQISSNYIQIYNDRYVINVHHKMLAQEIAWDEDYENFMKGFEPLLKTERISLGDYTDIYRRERQNLTELKIENQDPILISEQYDNIKMYSDYGKFISGVFSEKRYYIRYNSMDTMISIFSRTNDKDDADKLISYILSNIKSTNISYENSRWLGVDGISIPDSFGQTNVEVGNYTGALYTPKNMNDAFAGCFFETYMNVENIDYDFIKEIFLKTFPDVTDCNLNENNIQNFAISDRCISCGCSITSSRENTIMSVGSSWILEIYNIDGEMVIVGYPVAKANLMKTLFEVQQKETGF